MAGEHLNMKHSRFRHIAPAGSLCLLAAAALSSGAAPNLAAPSAAELSASARPFIEKANSEWLSAMQRQNADTLAAPYAEHAIFVTAAGDCIRGRTAIRDFYRARLAPIQVTDGKLVQESAVVSGSLVYEWGHASYTVVLKDGTRKTSGGAYLTVWQRSAVGAWEISRNLTL
jgi:uncharacterized protein (TIGR02246 family)